MCVCVFLLFLLNETKKKESEKRKKEDLRNIKWMGVIFLYLCDGFTEYIHFKFYNGGELITGVVLQKIRSRESPVIF